MATITVPEESRALFLWPEDKLKAEFVRLSARWREDTGHLSTTTRKYLHPAYQTIIGMGRQALPLILEDLRRQPGHWFWALRFIAQEDPAVGCDSVDSATVAWVEWGILKGYIER